MPLAGQTNYNVQLQEAAAAGQWKACKQAIQNGAIVDCRGINQWTPLMLAVQNNHVQVAKELLARRADPLAKTISGWTPLMIAAYRGATDCVILLLEELSKRAKEYAQMQVRDPPASTSSSNDSSSSASPSSSTSSSRGSGLESKETEEGSTGNPTGSSSSGKTLAERVAEERKLEEDMWYSLQVNASSDTEETPLTLATLAGHAEVVKILCEGRAAVGLVNGKGITALDIARREAAKEWVRQRRRERVRATPGTAPVPPYISPLSPDPAELEAGMLELFNRYIAEHAAANAANATNNTNEADSCSAECDRSSAEAKAVAHACNSPLTPPAQITCPAQLPLEIQAHLWIESSKLVKILKRYAESERVWLEDLERRRLEHQQDLERRMQEEQAEQERSREMRRRLMQINQKQIDARLLAAAKRGDILAAADALYDGASTQYRGSDGVSVISAARASKYPRTAAFLEANTLVAAKPPQTWTITDVHTWAEGMICAEVELRSLSRRRLLWPQLYAEQMNAYAAHTIDADGNSTSGNASVASPLTSPGAFDAAPTSRSMCSGFTSYSSSVGAATFLSRSLAGNSQLQLSNSNPTEVKLLPQANESGEHQEGSNGGQEGGDGDGDSVPMLSPTNMKRSSSATFFACAAAASCNSAFALGDATPCTRIIRPPSPPHSPAAATPVPAAITTVAIVATTQASATTTAAAPVVTQEQSEATPPTEEPAQEHQPQRVEAVTSAQTGVERKGRPRSRKVGGRHLDEHDHDVQEKPEQLEGLLPVEDLFAAVQNEEGSLEDISSPFNPASPQPSPEKGRGSEVQQEQPSAAEKPEASNPESSAPQVLPSAVPTTGSESEKPTHSPSDSDARVESELHIEVPAESLAENASHVPSPSRSPKVSSTDSQSGTDQTEGKDPNEHQDQEELESGHVPQHPLDFRGPPRRQTESKETKASDTIRAEAIDPLDTTALAGNSKVLPGSPAELDGLVVDEDSTLFPDDPPGDEDAVVIAAAAAESALGITKGKSGSARSPNPLSAKIVRSRSDTTVDSDGIGRIIVTAEDGTQLEHKVTVYPFPSDINGAPASLLIGGSALCAGLFPAAASAAAAAGLDASSLTVSPTTPASPTAKDQAPSPYTVADRPPFFAAILHELKRLARVDGRYLLAPAFHSLIHNSATHLSTLLRRRARVQSNGDGSDDEADSDSDKLPCMRLTAQERLVLRRAITALAYGYGSMSTTGSGLRASARAFESLENLERLMFREEIRHWRDSMRHEIFPIQRLSPRAFSLNSLLPHAVVLFRTDVGARVGVNYGQTYFPSITSSSKLSTKSGDGTGTNTGTGARFIAAGITPTSQLVRWWEPVAARIVGAPSEKATTRQAKHKYSMHLLCDALSLLPIDATAAHMALSFCDHRSRAHNVVTQEFIVEASDDVIIRCAPYLAYVYYCVARQIDIVSGSSIMSSVGKALASRSSNSTAPNPNDISLAEAEKMEAAGQTIPPMGIEKLHRDLEMLADANAHLIAEDILERRGMVPLPTSLTSQASVVSICDGAGLGMAGDPLTSFRQESLLNKHTRDIERVLIEDQSINWELEAENMLRACGYIRANQTLRDPAVAAHVFNNNQLTYARNLLSQVLIRGKDASGGRWRPPQNTAGLIRLKDTLRRRYAYMCPRHAKLAEALDKDRFVRAAPNDLEYMDPTIPDPSFKAGRKRCYK